MSIVDDENDTDFFSDMETGSNQTVVLDDEDFVPPTKARKPNKPSRTDTDEPDDEDTDEPYTDTDDEEDVDFDGPDEDEDDDSDLIDVFDIEAEPAPTKDKAASKRENERVRALVDEKNKILKAKQELEKRLEQEEERSRRIVLASSESLAKSIESDLKSLRLKAKQQMEEGETEAALETQEAIFEKKALLADVIKDKAAVEEEIKQAKEKVKTPEPEDELANLPTEAKIWLDKNAWIHKDKSLFNLVKRISAKVEDLGYDWETPEFYKKVNEMLVKARPDKFRIAKKAQKKAPVGGQSSKGTGVTRPGQKNLKTVLTKDQKQAADALGITYKEYAEGMKLQAEQKGY